MMNISMNIKQNSFKLYMNIAICYVHTIFTLFVYNMVGFGIKTLKVNILIFIISLHCMMI